jgi:hypothetical protein
MFIDRGLYNILLAPQERHAHIRIYSSLGTFRSLESCSRKIGCYVYKHSAPLEPAFPNGG